MEWSLLLLLPVPVVQVAVAHPVDDLGQLAESTQLADYDSGHFVTRGAGNRARWQGFKNILFDGRRRDFKKHLGRQMYRCPDADNCSLSSSDKLL